LIAAKQAVARAVIHWAGDYPRRRPIANAARIRRLDFFIIHAFNPLMILLLKKRGDSLPDAEQCRQDDQ
jgi:hypothetical protein